MPLQVPGQQRVAEIEPQRTALRKGHVDAVVDRVAAREDRCTRRGADGLCVVVVEHEPRGSKLVDSGRGDLGGAVEGHVVESKVVGHDEND